MSKMTRRTFAKLAGASVLLGAGASRSLAAPADEGGTSRRRFTKELVCGAIGVRADQRRAIALARRFGFESVAPSPHELAGLSDGQLEELRGELKETHLMWGAAGLPVDFRRDERRFRSGMQRLPHLAASLRRAGVVRVGTWLRPTHDTLTYRANFELHVRRLCEVAGVLADHGLRFGLEYVGPKTSWAASRYPFVHTLAEARELIAEIGRNNVGLVLDSWHWYTAHETADDLASLTNADVVACHLNDAPAGIPVDEQRDNERELPAATGVIDLKAFLGALVAIGYDGPVRAEPFNKKLNAMADEAAVAATAAAMNKAFALVS